MAFISNDGEMFGEEYTLVACADYVLSKTPGNTVSNMSSSRALRDITNKYNGSYQASAVGEVNVVELMKKTNAILMDALNESAIDRCNFRDDTRFNVFQSGLVIGREKSLMMVSTSSGSSIIAL